MFFRMQGKGKPRHLEIFSRLELFGLTLQLYCIANNMFRKICVNVSIESNGRHSIPQANKWIILPE